MALTPYTRAYGNLPLTQITPFTYRDGLTFLQILNEFEKWLREVTPEIEALLKENSDYITGVENNWLTLWTEFMENVNAELEALNDQAVANLVNQVDSKIREALDTLISATIDDRFEPFEQDVNDRLAAFRTELDTQLALMTQRLTNEVFGRWDQVDENDITAVTVEPVATTVYKMSALGFQYEVTTVKTHGRSLPHLMSRRFSKDMQDSIGTGDSFIIPSEMRDDMHQHMEGSDGAGFIFNASGYQTLSGNNPPQYRVRGVQIHKGEVYSDFEPTSNRGRHALGWRKDGTFRAYGIQWGDSAASMIADGVTESYGFGPILVRNGVAQNIEALTYYGSLVNAANTSARTILGSTVNGDIKVITVSGESGDPDGVGVAGNNIVSLANQERLYNAVLLDGGGSTQAASNGVVFHPSSDSAGLRPAPDVGLIRCSSNSPNSMVGLGRVKIPVPAQWLPENADYSPVCVYKGGTVQLFGNLEYGSEIPTSTWFNVGTLPYFARPDIPLGSGVFIPVATNIRSATATLQIRAYGAMSLNVSTPGITGVTLSNTLVGK